MSTCRPVFGVLCAAIALLSLRPLCHADDFEQLLKKVPPGSNTLVLMDAEALLKTPLAAREGWSKKLEANFMDRSMYVPPEAKQVVVAGYVNPTAEFEREWELALMSLSQPIAMRAVAMAEGGYVDTIKGMSVVWAPSGVYFLETGASELGLIYPAERQRVSRWIDSIAGSATVQISPYLRQVASSVSPQSQVVLGIDLTDVAEPHRVDQRIKDGELDLGNVKPEDFIRLVTGLKGITLQLSVSDSVSATASVDFSTPVSLSPTVAKSLVLRALTEFGAEIPAMADWKCDVTSTSIHLSGALDAESLRRVMSLLELPSTKFSELSETDVADDSLAETKSKSLAYFKTVTSLLESLRPKTIGNSGGGGDAVWMERYARKIDSLPILHVDKELLDYGTKLSETLRIMSGARKQSGVAGGVAAANIGASGTGYGDYGYNYNGAGYGEYGYNRMGAGTALANQSNAETAAKRSLQAGATNIRIQGWQLIDNATADIRRTMTERYQVEF